MALGSGAHGSSRVGGALGGRPGQTLVGKRDKGCEPVLRSQGSSRGQIEEDPEGERGGQSCCSAPRPPLFPQETPGPILGVEPPGPPALSATGTAVLVPLLH